MQLRVFLYIIALYLKLITGYCKLSFFFFRYLILYVTSLHVYDIWLQKLFLIYLFVNDS